MNDKDNETRRYVEAIKSIQGDPVRDVMVCPRCGRVVENEDLQRLARSRYADTDICSVCGIEESLLDDILPLNRWSNAKSLPVNRDESFI